MPRFAILTLAFVSAAHAPRATRQVLLAALMAAGVLIAGRPACAVESTSGTQPERTIDWRTSPLDLDLRGMNGEKYTFYCPPGKPEPSFVAGSGPYTDASSICTAAVHAGAIRAGTGGSVTIEIRPGQNGGYVSSERNYIKTNSYDHPWSGSFVVAAPNGASAKRNAALVSSSSRHIN